MLLRFFSPVPHCTASQEHSFRVVFLPPLSSFLLPYPFHPPVLSSPCHTHGQGLHNFACISAHVTIKSYSILDSRKQRIINGTKKRFPELTCPPLFSVRNWYCTLWSGNAACETPVMVTAACSSVPTASPATHRHILNFYCRINARPPQVFDGHCFTVDESAVKQRRL